MSDQECPFRASRPRLRAAKDAATICIKASTPPTVKAKQGDSAPPTREEEVAAIVVPTRLQSPCELVERAKAALELAKTDSIGFVQPPQGCLAIRTSRDQLPRALRIADALLKAFAAQGWDVATSQQGIGFRVDGTRIALRIDEGTQVEQRPVTPDLNRSYSFHYEQRNTLKRPSGHLSIGIEEESKIWRYSQRRHWNDSEKRPIEARLNSVLVGMIKLAEAVKADNARKEREAQEQEEQRRRLQAAAEEQQRLRAAVAAERSRVAALRDQARLWHEAQLLRGFVAEARKQGRKPGEAVASEDIDHWAEWALAQADRLDPFTPSPHSILDEADRIERVADATRGRA